MRFHVLLAGVAVLVISSIPASATTAAGIGARDSLIVDSLENWSVGGTIKSIDRSIKTDNSVSQLKADAFAAFIGRDLTDWLTGFITLGGNRIKNDETGEAGNTSFAWSIGLQANMWKTAVTDPSFLAGNLSLRGIMEGSQYKVDLKDAGISGDWTDISMALTVNYEMFAEKETTLNAVPFSLLLYVGPAASFINGSAGVSGRLADFEGDQIVGLIGGMDLYVSHNLSIGGQIEYYSDPTFGVNLIYHF